MDVIAIQTEAVQGQRIDPVRAVTRTVLEVDVIPANGTLVCGRYVPQGKHRVEVYSDQVASVLERVRDKAARAAEAQAAQMAAAETDVWATRTYGKALAALEVREGAEVAAAERARLVAAHSPHEPAHYLAMLGYPRGLPTLASCREVEVRAAPDTPATLASRQQSELAAAIAQAIKAAKG